MVTDIAFDRPVEPLLHAIARCRGICAGSESFSKLSTADSVGAALFQNAGIETGEARGFNAGCQGFATLAATKNYFNLVLHIAESHRSLDTGGVCKFVDQPIANYVAHMTEAVDTGPITAAMRLSFPPLSAAAADRRGLVHFWPALQPEPKRAAMQAYIEALIAADAHVPTPEPQRAAAGALA